MDAKVLEEFPDYVIEKDGSIYNSSNGLRRKPSRTRSGAMKITLYKNGVPYTRSLPLLVAQTYLYNDHDPDVFDTPIHLDNDLSNNHVDNLKWRPRWFAVKYQQQYWNENYRYSEIRVQDVGTGEVYDSVMGPCQRHGLLFVDVMKSCMNGDTVFPTWKKFQFI